MTFTKNEVWECYQFARQMRGKHNRSMIMDRDDWEIFRDDLRGKLGEIALRNYIMKNIPNANIENHKGKEVRLMKPSDFQKTVQCRFESCLKKVVRSVVKDYYKELNRRKNKEISFSELPDVLVDKMAVWDDYETDYTIFSVCGIDIRVLDDELAEALKKLPERKRNTLLMYYFLEMTESEIANLQKITQSGVFRNRHHA